MCRSEDRVANRFGRCFHRKKERFNLKDLKPGDHIVAESLYGLGITFWHHMIVESVDLGQKQINVIHYYHDLDPIWKWTSICRNSFTFTPDKFYRIVYEAGECLPASEVLKKARARLGEEQYCPLTNNCEHFANDCKTGEKKCHQIWTSIEILGKSAISSIASFLYKTRRELKDVGPEVLEYGAIFSPTLAFIIATIIETVLLGRDCNDAKAKFDEGKLSREEFIEVIVRRVFAALCSIPVFPFSSYVGVIN